MWLIAKPFWSFMPWGRRSTNAGLTVMEERTGSFGKLSRHCCEAINRLVRHFVGPAWELANGDTVEGKQSATAPGATSDDVALLKLDVVKHTGNWILKDATSVLRLNTRGGILKGACQTAGELRTEPYSADYTFLR